MSDAPSSFGGTGQVGEEFRALALPKDVEVVAPSRGELDLEDPLAIARRLRLSRGVWSSMRPLIPMLIGQNAMSPLRSL